MGTPDKQLPLTNRQIQIDQAPVPITKRARAADLADYAKKHKVYNRDYSKAKFWPRKPGDAKQD